MNKMKSTQGVMINVKNDVQRFINDDHNTSTMKIYKKKYDEISEKINELAHIEELILQEKCITQDKIKIKLSILREYVYARCPFYRLGNSSKDIRVIVSRLDMIYDNTIPTIDELYKDKLFMHKAEDKLIKAMTREYLEKSKNTF